MPLLTEAEHLQRYLNYLSGRMSYTSYGTPYSRANKMKREAKKNAIYKEQVATWKKLNNALLRNRTIKHHNMVKANQPRYNDPNWMSKHKTANWYNKVLPKAQALRNKILRRRALAIIRRYWYQPPVTGRGYLRQLNKVSSRWN